MFISCQIIQEATLSCEIFFFFFDAFVYLCLTNVLSFIFVGQEIKRRKRHRRKHFQDQEPCVMRGVYFKNMKWQAAIKVDKKQIHLGTVGSQEEAAHLYDRYL